MIGVDGGSIAAQALADAGARRVFGIPGTHNVALYDALEGSPVHAVLVTDERAAAFMADGVSRSSEEVGVLSLVPGAGPAHALSGIAEAWLDQVPLVVLAAGVRADSGRAFQLHDIDQAAMLAPVVKALLHPRDGPTLYAAVRDAFELAREAPAGPVAVLVPAELFLLACEPPPAPYRPAARAPRAPSPEAVERAADLLNAARRPILLAGYGARGAAAALGRAAEALQAPVATTVMGKGVFPESHPLSSWSLLGRAAPPFAARELEQADAALAVGCRLGEVGTGSYDLPLPEAFIHVDADASALNRNYPAKLAIVADAGRFLEALVPKLKPRPRDQALEARLAAGRALADAPASAASEDRVRPGSLFSAFQRLAPGAIYSADSGNGLFLAMERLRLDRPGRWLAPVDFSCMGYSVPAAIGAKLANPGADAVAIVGDGALLMTGLSLLNAAAERAPIVACVLADGELGQIAQFQRRAFGRAPTTTLPAYGLRDFARLCGAEHVRAACDSSVEASVEAALASARAGRSAVLEVPIDASRPTFFTRGVLRANFARLPLKDKLRMAARKFTPR